MSIQHVDSRALNTNLSNFISLIEHLTENDSTMAAKSKIGKELLGGKFKFVSDNEVKCQYCNAVFKYHKSASSLNYHLRNKHPFSISAKTSEPSFALKPKSQSHANRQPTLLETASNQKPMEQWRIDGLTNRIAKWIAGDSRPVNIVGDEGLQEIIRLVFLRYTPR